MTTRADLIETAEQAAAKAHPFYRQEAHYVALAVIDAVLPQITTAERERIAQEIRDHIPPPWGGQADYWKAART